MPRSRVLIVDDSPADAGMLRRFLTSEGASEYHIMSADTGAEGLRLSAAFKPDVILLDYELPDMDGLEFMRDSTLQNPTEDAPVVLAVTGQSNPRVAADLIRAGAEGYIGKDEATPESVRLAVRQAARTRAMRSALAERAREREQSRGELLASLRRASFIAHVSEALSRSLSVSGVLDAIVGLTVPALASACFVDLLVDGQLVRQRVRADGVLSALETPVHDSALKLDGFEGPAKVLRSGAPASYARSWLPALARWDRNVGHALQLAPVESAIVVPLIFDNAPIGALTLLSLDRLDGYAQDVAGEIGRRVSAALTNARAFEAEQTAKRASEEARRRLALLSHVSELFARSLEWRDTLRDIVASIVPAIADHSSVSLFDGDDVKVVASSGEEAAARGASLPRRTERTTSGPEFYPDVNLMRKYGDATRTLHAVGDGGGSFVRVPVAAPNGATVGEFTLSTLGERRLTLDDLGFAEDLGRRIGMYVETARVFEREREIARSLQRSLLPPDIPLVPGVEFAARCVAGSEAADVGGDWYDVIPMRDGRVAFAVGDVAGRGVLAAATMGQLRSSLRAYALEGLSPADALARLNAFMLSQERMEFATVVLGILECTTGRVALASAGHLPPLVIDPDGKARPVALQSSLPVGVVNDLTPSDTTFTLQAGQSLALFTDGLVESRSKDIDLGTGELLERLQRSDDAHDLLDRALAMVPDDPVDDITFLAVRYAGVGAGSHDSPRPGLHVTLPAIPPSAAQVRKHLEQFCERIGLDRNRIFDLQLAVGEAVANAIEHAYSSRGDAIFSVHARKYDDQVQIDVLDQGRWREGVRTPRGQLSERGRGIGLMRSLCDDVRIERTLVGTHIQLGLRMDERERLA